jgi:DNA-binding HxlR family transcriptional regulator
LTLETAVREALEKGEVLVPAIPVTSCPIAATLEVLGKKWALEILRDIGMRKNERFSQLLESVQGISPRLLSRRLRELEASGLVRRIEEPATPKKVVWRFTEKGWDTLPILMSYVAFGSKYFPERVFPDGQPREMKEMYPAPIVEKFFVPLNVDEQRAAHARRRKEVAVANVQPAANW